MGMDYYFITKEGIKRRDELAAELGDDSEETVTQARAKGQLVKCMAVRCFKSKNIFKHVVLQNGDDAGASKIKFILDPNEYSIDRLLNPQLAGFQVIKLPMKGMFLVKYIYPSQTK